MTTATIGEKIVAQSGLAFAGGIRVQAERMRVGNQVRMSHLALGGRKDALAELIQPKLEEIEELIEHAMQREAQESVVWPWASRVKGTGGQGMVVGAVMSRVDIYRVNTVSGMWAHFGFAPGQKRVKGQKIDYDAVGKTWCWRLGDCLLKANGKFKAVYDKRKEYEVARVLARGGKVKPAKSKMGESDMSLGHVHARAMRHMIKVYLACMYKVWREGLGLPVQPPYIIGRADASGHVHTTEYMPEEFADK